MKNFFLTLFLSFICFFGGLLKLIVGEEKLIPESNLFLKVQLKILSPLFQKSKSRATNVHIEAELIGMNKHSEGAVPGGFIPYLKLIL